MSSKMSSSFEDEVKPSLFEELEEYIFQGLKWKQEGKKKKKKKKLFFINQNRKFL